MAPNKPSIGIRKPALSSAKHPVPRVITAGEEKCDSPRKTPSNKLVCGAKKRRGRKQERKKRSFGKKKTNTTSVIPEKTTERKKSNDENEETSFLYDRERDRLSETPFVTAIEIPKSLRVVRSRAKEKRYVR